MMQPLMRFSAKIRPDELVKRPARLLAASKPGARASRPARRLSHPYQPGIVTFS